MNEIQQFVIVLAAAPGVTNDTAVRSLRAFLKGALRAYGLRCLSAEKINANAATQDAAKPADEGQNDEPAT